MIRRWSRRRKGRIRIVLGVMQHEKREQQDAFPSQPLGGLFPQRELHTLCLHPQGPCAPQFEKGRTHLGEGASFPNVLSSLLPSLTRGACTDLGLMTSLRCSAG